jgi:3-deoxy-D-manno-octulosonic-acid transferase
MFALYGAALRLVWAALLPYQIVMGWLRRGGVSRRDRVARGPAPEGLRPGSIWVHAVSFGEVRLAHAVIEGLRARLPGASFHLTTSTATGLHLATAARRERRRGAADSVSAAPLDLPGPLGRFEARVQPRALVLIETELWPNLLRRCARAGRPILILNARLSERAWPRTRRFRSLFAPGLAGAALVAAQSEADASRYRTLGAPPASVQVTGNLKFDLPPASGDSEALRVRLALPPDAFVFVAGSTARGEEEAVARAFGALRSVRPDARLVIAPRHPEDNDRTARHLEQAGFTVARYRGPAAPDAGSQVAGTGAVADAVLVEVMGILPALYPLAAIAFVGGSLVPRGGQNLLEPAAVGVPVLFGPQVENFRFAADALLASGGGFMARDADDLAARVVILARDEAARAATGARAKETVARHRGALAACLDRASACLRPLAGAASAPPDTAPPGVRPDEARHASR